ncbi:MAG: hypothetical protein GC147_12840 [Porphyrobacter sp.]|nr:hypothetical protein [Porphyrobacter sp.]
MKFTSTLAAGLGIAALAAAPALAQQANPDRTTSMQRQQWAQWQQTNNETVSAQRILGGDVTNGFNMLGNITDLILDPQGQRIEYVLYEVPYPYKIYGSDDGFVRWDNVAFERGYDSDVDLRIDDDAQAEAKQQLTLTRSQARGRMASRIVGGDLMFADGSSREIDDILFDPKTGMITDFVVELDADSLFDSDTRRVPAAMVRFDQGRWMVAQPVTYDWQVWVF